MFPLFALWSDWSFLALRLAVGAIFVAHGWPKLKNIKATAQNFSAMGFHPGSFWGPLVAVVEFFGGLALLLGFWTQAAVAIFVLEFVVINIWKIAKRQPFVSRAAEGYVAGFEFDLLLLAAALALFTIGGGNFSLDHYLFLGGF